MFPSTLKGTAADWFHSLTPSSISSFAQLKEKFPERFAGTIKIKKDPMELFSMETVWEGNFVPMTRAIH